jgi:DNA-binding beta-propeller fold protein YncE
MSLSQLGFIPLPPHTRSGGFDHAAIHQGTGRLYVAHTVNDAVDVIDCRQDRYLYSISGLTGVAGTLVSDERNLIFTSNRGENTVGIFAPEDEVGLARVAVGVRPNGLAYDPKHNLLLAANVGDPALPGSFTVSVVDVAREVMIANIPAPGRTRWAVYDAMAEVFYVNIMEPAQIVVIDATDPARVTATISILVAGPHGLDLDSERGRLFCACDGKELVVLDTRTRAITDTHALSGVPDVVFFNAGLHRLYVAVGDPGVIDVFDTAIMRRVESVPTEKGTHTIGLDPACNKVYAFLPQSCGAAVYSDNG